MWVIFVVQLHGEYTVGTTERIPNITSNELPILATRNV